MDPEVRENLCEEIQGLVLAFEKQETQDYKRDPIMRVQVAKNRLAALSKFNILNGNQSQQDYIQIQTCLDQAQNIISIVVEQMKDPVGCIKSLLPFNFYYRRVCEIEQQRIANKETFQKELDQKQEKLIEEYIKKIQGINSTQLINAFKEIFNNNEYLGATLGYIKKLFKIIQERIQDSKQLQGQRLDAKVEESKSLNEDEIMNDTSIREVDYVEQTVMRIEDYITYEHIEREMYYYTHLRGNSQRLSNAQNQYLKLIRLKIQQGSPFELIDGDNIKYIKGVYDQLQGISNSQDQIFVISVIGPQSAGKSLLMNFLFGLELDSSQGRCTKGVFCAEFNYKSSDNVKKKVLILDTEGIQASEGRSEEFDRRIVFYTLCVSHLVIICNKGEMNSQMAEVLKLAAETISKLSTNVLQPKVLVVMNAQTVTNSGVLNESIKKLSEAIQLLDQDIDKTHQLFDLSPQNVFILPFAFDKRGQKGFQVHQPSEEFSDFLEPLKQKILQIMDQQFNQDCGNHSKKSSKEWFVFSQEFWGFSENQRGFMEYRSVSQKRQELELRKKIDEIENDNFSSQESIDRNIEEVLKIIEQEFAKIKGTYNITFDTVYNQVEAQIIGQKYLCLEQALKDEFLAFCKQIRVCKEFVIKYTSSLMSKLNFQRDQWLILAKERITEFVLNESKTMGLCKMNSLAYHYLQEKPKYDLKEAKKIAKKSWKQIEEDIISSFRKDDDIRYSVFDLIQKNYQLQLKQNIYWTSTLSSMLEGFEKQEKNFLLQQLEDLKKEFLFGEFELKLPNREKFMGAFKQSKNFIRKLTKKDIKVNMIKKRFDWIRFLNETFDIQAFADKLQDIMKIGYLSNAFHSTLQRSNYRIQNVRVLLAQIYSLLESIGIKVKPTLSEKIVSKFSKTQDIYWNSHPGLKNSDILEKLSEDIKYIIKCSIQPDAIEDSFCVDGMFEEFSFDMVQKSPFFKKFEPEMFVDYIDHLGKEKYQQRTSTRNMKQKFMDSAPFERILINSKYDDKTKKFFQFLMQDSTSGYNYHPFVFDSGLSLVYEMLNMESFVNQIEEIVLSNVKVNCVKGSQDNIKDICKSFRNGDHKYHVKEFAKVEKAQIYQISNQVKSYIADINEELSRYLIKLSEKGESILHQIAVVLLSSLSIEHQIKLEREPLEQIRKAKDQQIQIFCAKLTSNEEELDKQLAQQLSNSLLEKILAISKQQAKIKFNKQLQQSSIQFEKSNIVQQIESLAQEFAFDGTEILEYKDYKNCKNENDRSAIIDVIKGIQFEPNSLDDVIVNIVEYFIDPKKFFQGTFHSIWNEFGEQHLDQQFETLKVRIKNDINKLKNYFEELQGKIELSGCTMSSMENFNLVNEDANLQEITKRFGQLNNGIMKELSHRSAALYLRMMVNQQLKPENKEMKRSNSGFYQEICLEGIWISLSNKQFSLPVSSQLKEKVEDDLLEVFEISLKNEKISNLNKFLKHLISYLEAIDLDDIDKQSIKNEILEDKKLQMQSKLTGCQEYCPLCRKQCDEVHKENEDASQIIHNCKSGHRMQGFGGNREQKKNKSMNVTCNNLQNTDDITHEGQTLKWAEFKATEKLKMWDFDVNDQVLASNVKQNSDIWNHFGPLTCEIYQEEQNIGIQFARANDKPYQKLHYVLVLDESGSMNGIPWENLMTSVKLFLDTLAENPVNQANSMVSVINFGGIARRVVREEFPQPNLVLKINFQGQPHTCFDTALKEAYDLIQETLDMYDRHLFCFLTDGNSYYPENVIKTIQNDKDVFDKITFKAIFYGKPVDGHQNVLKQMCNALEGTFEISMDVEDLKAQFKSLVVNIYQSN